MIHEYARYITLAAIEINDLARDRGWWDEPRTVGDAIALMHSELSEALEEHRNGRAVNEVYLGENEKPEGIPVELADVVIRVFDFCAEHGINIGAVIAKKHKYNETRPYRHGGKKL